MSSSIQIRAIEDVNLVDENIVAIYRTVFASMPYNKPPKMADMFVELAVLPGFQGSGVDSRLHDELIRRRNERTAIATTVRDNTPAYDFCLRRGWQSLRDDFTFPGIAEPQVIIGSRILPV